VSADTLVRPASGFCGGIVSRSSAAWLGCVSEDAWLSTLASPESVWELKRGDKTATTNWIPQNCGENGVIQVLKIYIYYQTYFAFCPLVRLGIIIWIIVMCDRYRDESTTSGMTLY
jgi:hypothetical protein